MSQPVILTDLDNTIYNWVDYFSPCFRAMVHVLARETRISEEAIIEDFKRVYSKHGNVEYAFSVQELELCRNKRDEELERLVRVAKGAFSRVREKNLQPYDGVKDTLIWAAKQGIPVVGITNAPLYYGKRRLRQLHLESLFAGLAGWEGNPVPENHHWTRAIKQREEEGKYPTRIQKLWSLSLEELKPSPIGYLRIIKELHASHKETYVIGDSLHKDIRPALEIGAIGIHAKYGEKYDSKNWETLLKITHWTKEKIASVYDDKSLQPTFVVNSFSELQNLVEPAQLTLPGFACHI